MISQIQHTHFHSQFTSFLFPKHKEPKVQLFITSPGFSHSPNHLSFFHGQPFLPQCTTIPLWTLPNSFLLPIFRHGHSCNRAELLPTLWTTNWLLWSTLPLPPEFNAISSWWLSRDQQQHFSIAGSIEVCHFSKWIITESQCWFGSFRILEFKEKNKNSGNFSFTNNCCKGIIDFKVPKFQLQKIYFNI